MAWLIAIFVVVVLWMVFVSGKSKPPAVRRPSSDSEPETPKFTYTITTSGYEAPSPGATDADRDEWEGSFWEVAAAVPVDATLRIGYVDGAGKRTERTVEVRQFGAYEGGALIIGKCLLRGATRTFRTDRIKSCVDLETGEIVGDVQAFLQRKFDQSPERSAIQLRDTEFDVLRVLLYVGKADGQFRAEEKAVVLETCVSLTNESRLTMKMVQDILNELNVPTLQAFKLAVGRLAKREAGQRSLVLSAAEKMIATQKVVHPAEQEAMDYMKKRFAV